MSENEKINRIWKPIEFNDSWLNADTSILDDLSPSWYKRRKELTEDSKSYINFLNELKREHAIETGVVEHLYDIKKGITETLIKNGFVQSYLSHGDTNIDESDLFAHLNDHLEAVEMIFDVVKDDHRPLGTSFIKELHQLTTRHQKHAEGRDQFGNRLKIPLLKGEFKKRENNPTAPDGTVVKYCPPEHVDSEMDNLITIYNDLATKEIHPLLIATWLHHAFVSIHPFQDGNGRVARLLTSLVFIKNGLFPFTVLREEAKVKYIDALEEADVGKLQKLVDYFALVQKRNIEKALNLPTVVSSSLEEVQDIFANKIIGIKEEEEQKRKEQYYLLKVFEENRNSIFELCYSEAKEIKENLESKINGNANVSISRIPFIDDPNAELDIKLDIITFGRDIYESEIQNFSRIHKYDFSLTFRKSWIAINIDISREKKYRLFISIHHYGYDNSSLAIGAFVVTGGTDYKDYKKINQLGLPPHIISIEGNLESKQKNIKKYLENVMTVSLAQITSEL